MGGDATDMTFRRPGEDGSDDEDIGPSLPTADSEAVNLAIQEEAVPVADLPPIIIHDDD